MGENSRRGERELKRRAEAGTVKRAGLSGTALKCIAAAAMLLDHIGACLIENGLLCAYDSERIGQILNTEWGMRWYWFDLILRMIGRVAFPIFAFLLVEGFFHTRSRKHYVKNCLIFALISEIPFDLASANPVGYSSGMAEQNIYFTLTLGLLMMAALERWGTTLVKRAIIVLAACGTAILLHVDYEALGILVIAIFYLFRGNRRSMYGLSAAVLIAESAGTLGTAALALIPISHYNGERGGGKFAVGHDKYLFYWFYPVHLMLLSLTAHILLGK